MRIGRGQFFEGDCFDVMRTLPDASVDMVLCDLPYGTTQNKWDSVLPLEMLWSEYRRIAKPRAAIVLTAMTPFNMVLGVSNLQNFKYQWIWEKTAATGFFNAKKAPLRAHECILVFSQGTPQYYPQMTAGAKIKRVNGSVADHGTSYGKAVSIRPPYESTERYPRDVQVFAKDNRMGRPHPTQKPVALFEYLIRTYTHEGMTVLDNTAGSGTTAIAAENAGRNWICIERDPEYAAKAMDRIRRHVGETVDPAPVSLKRRFNTLLIL